MFIRSLNLIKCLTILWTDWRFVLNVAECAGNVGRQIIKAHDRRGHVTHSMFFFVSDTTARHSRPCSYTEHTQATELKRAIMPIGSVMSLYLCALGYNLRPTYFPRWQKLRALPTEFQNLASCKRRWWKWISNPNLPLVPTQTSVAPVQNPPQQMMPMWSGDTKINHTISNRDEGYVELLIEAHQPDNNGEMQYKSNKNKHTVLNTRFDLFTGHFYPDICMVSIIMISLFKRLLERAFYHRMPRQVLHYEYQ